MIDPSTSGDRFGVGDGPPPIAFVRDAADVRRFRLSMAARNASGDLVPVFAAAAVVAAIAAGIGLWLQRPFAPLWLVVAALDVAAVLVARNGLPATTAPRSFRLTWSEAGARLERKTTARRTVARVIPFARIRLVQITPDDIALVGWLTALAVIPRRALPDGGDALLRFLERELEGTRALRRTGPRTTIVNTRARKRPLDSR